MFLALLDKPNAPCRRRNSCMSSIVLEPCSLHTPLVIHSRDSLELQSIRIRTSVYPPQTVRADQNKNTKKKNGSSPADGRGGIDITNVKAMFFGHCQELVDFLGVRAAGPTRGANVFTNPWFIIR